MEKIVEQGLLYDFYGELLTEHQKKIYEDVVYQDLSLGEIAQENGITRQGVHDLIKRCNNVLQEYEDKMHLVQRFLVIREEVNKLQKSTEDDSTSKDELVQAVQAFSHKILEEL